MLRTATSGPHGGDEGGGPSSHSGSTTVASGNVSGSAVPSTSNAAVSQDGSTVASSSHASGSAVAGLANILAQSVAAAVGGTVYYSMFLHFFGSKKSSSNKGA